MAELVMLTPEEQDKLFQIQAIYADLPTVECQGKCFKGCSNAPITVLETKAIRLAHGLTVEYTPPTRTNQLLREATVCPALDKDTKRCTAYELRPMSCRMFGVINRCAWGCKPTRVVGALEYAALQSAVDLLGGVDGVSRSAIIKQLKGLEIPYYRDRYLKAQLETLAAEEAKWKEIKRQHPDG